MARSPRKSAAQWEQLVSKFQSGTRSERDFCTHHSLVPSTFRKWRYYYAAQKPAKQSVAPAAFVKVLPTASAPLPQGVVLCMGQTLRVECPVSYDATALAELALALHHGC